MNNLSSVTTKGQVTIPVSMRKRLNISKGSKVIFSREKARITITKAPNFFDLKGSIQSDKRFSESTIDATLRKNIKKNYEPENS